MLAVSFVATQGGEKWLESSLAALLSPLFFCSVLM